MKAPVPETTPTFSSYAESCPLPLRLYVLLAGAVADIEIVADAVDPAGLCEGRRARAAHILVGRRELPAAAEAVRPAAAGERAEIEIIAHTVRPAGLRERARAEVADVLRSCRELSRAAEVVAAAGSRAETEGKAGRCCRRSH